MFNEISITQKSKIIVFQNYEFWRKVIKEKVTFGDSVTIITYNFNFTRVFENSLFNILIDLINKGCEVKLIYAKTNEKETVNGFINQFGIIGCCEDNHSKMFLSNKFAYMGSANFSYGSNKNIENGFVTTDLKIIREINKQFIPPIISSKNFKWISLPEFMPISDLIETINKVLLYLNEYIEKITQDKRISESFRIKGDYLSSNIEIFKSINDKEREIKDLWELLYYSVVYKKRSSEKETIISYLKELRIIYNDYYDNLHYILNRGGVVRLYLDNGMLTDVEDLSFSCDGSYKND